MSISSFLPLRGEATRTVPCGGWGSTRVEVGVTPTRAASSGASLASPLQGEELV